MSDFSTSPTPAEGIPRAATYKLTGSEPGRFVERIVRRDAEKKDLAE